MLQIKQAFRSYLLYLANGPQRGETEEHREASDHVLFMEEDHDLESEQGSGASSQGSLVATHPTTDVGLTRQRIIWVINLFVIFVGVVSFLYILVVPLVIPDHEVPCAVKSYLSSSLAFCLSTLTKFIERP